MAQVLATNMLVKLQIWSHDSEQAAVNTFHYKVTSVGGTPGTLEDLAADWSATVVPSYKVLLNQQVFVDGVIGQIVFPLPLHIAVKDISQNGNAGGAANGAARQAAGLIAWRTPLAGAGGRGRTYIPFTGDGDSTGIGIPNAAYITNAGIFAVAVSTYTTFTVAGRSANVVFGVKARNSSTFTIIDAGNVVSKWATQKRRGSYGRPNNSPF